MHAINSMHGTYSTAPRKKQSVTSRKKNVKDRRMSKQRIQNSYLVTTSLTCFTL